VRSLERALDLLEALERLRVPVGVRALEEITRILEGRQCITG
jgi:hypothetical protein